ncbi:MAG: hypothetical protein IT306_29235 [Chloroflexi bacterium]|nr:hypothetical protein [Chloroflexota bacterium]
MSSKPQFFVGEETAIIDLGDGFWVELNRELDYGQESELEGAAIRDVGVDGNGQMRAEFSLNGQRGLMLALYIADWNLVSPKGKPVPLPDNLAERQKAVLRLRPAWGKRIVAEIEKLRADDGEPTAIAVPADEDGANPT